VRTFGPSFTYANQAAEKSPRFVIGIRFETESIYLTSHAGIPNVPGQVIENVLQRPSAISQRIVPDQGRSEIGALTFSAIDKAVALTQALKDKLTGGAGLRGKQVRLYQGFSGADFSEYSLFQTQVVQGAAVNDGVYSVKCADITREQRKSIFDPKRTTLAAQIDADDTTIQVLHTDGFAMIEHGDSFSDAPNATVGYIRIDEEVIRYTGIAASPPRFTGCQRGRFNTRAVPHTVDVTQPQDQRTRVEEYIYLELPVPKLILAVLTGELYGQAATLPAHWHLGIDADTWVNEDDFTELGADLWDPDSDSASFVGYFAGMKKIDGKQFLEKECYQLIGCFPLVYSDGRLGIKRMNAVLADAPGVVELNEDNLVSWTELRHEMDSLANHYRVEWNYTRNGSKDEFTRVTEFIDATSIDLHGTTDAKVLSFKGLYGSRHTNATVRARIDSQRDRYGHPPVSMSVTALPSYNFLEVGDIVRVRLATVYDFTAPGNVISLYRAFEIQRKSENHATGDVTLELFGSTRPASQTPPDPGGGEGPDGENSLPDDWYSSEGTELSTVVDISVVGDVGVIDAGTWTLDGHANLRNGGAIFYYLGDLTLPDNATLRILDNVQLRVRGFLTINGTIDGVGRGLDGVSDTAGYGTSANGQRGYFGNSRGMDGVNYELDIVSVFVVPKYWTLAARLTQGQASAVPFFSLSVANGALAGLPSDLRGTSGGPGGKVSDYGEDDVKALGGAGAAGGSGLCVVCRGMSLGASGEIDLSGSDSSTPSQAPTDEVKLRPGAGGAGAPGALLILLDGAQLPVPDLGGKFVAETGHVGAPLLNPLKSASGSAFTLGSGFSQPGEGFADPAMISDRDMSNSAYRIQYIPPVQTPVEDTPGAVPAPTALTATGVANGVQLKATLPPFSTFDSVQYYASVDNDRANAVPIADIKSSAFFYPLTSGNTRYFWACNERDGFLSKFYPESPTGGISGTAA
jgi:hypothetical protein